MSGGEYLPQAIAAVGLIWLGIRIARMVIDWAEPSDNSCHEFSDSDGASILRGEVAAPGKLYRAGGGGQEGPSAASDAETHDIAHRNGSVTP